MSILMGREWFDRLKQARLQAGLSPKEVAKIIKKHSASVIRAEKGQRPLGGDELITLALIYNVSLDDIFLPKPIAKVQ